MWLTKIFNLKCTAFFPNLLFLFKWVLLEVDSKFSCILVHKVPFLVSMIIVTFVIMLPYVCMYVCMCVCVCVCVCVWRLLVNTISQEGKLGQISYLVCRCTTLSTRTLLFLVEVKGHLGSAGVKLWKPCKHNISRRETCTDLIFGM